jgi:hypothetical protein
MSLTVLVVATRGDGEHWLRTFDGRRLEMRQYESRESELAERFGVLEFRFRLEGGLWSVADPQWLFRLTGMPLANHPAVFACLGMVLGLYGILYLEVARVPERGWIIAAVGLTGKVLWWISFALYLREAWPPFRASLRPA